MAKNGDKASLSLPPLEFGTLSPRRLSLRAMPSFTATIQQGRVSTIFDGTGEGCIWIR